MITQGAVNSDADEARAGEEQRQRHLAELLRVEALVREQQIAGVAPALPAFAPRSGQRAERRACLDEHQLVGKKGGDPSRVSCSPKQLSPAQRRQLFQPRRGF
jgi:hypothetical protein